MFRRGGLVKRGVDLGRTAAGGMFVSGGAGGVAVGEAGVARSPLRRSEARFAHGRGDARVNPSGPLYLFHAVWEVFAIVLSKCSVAERRENNREPQKGVYFRDRADLSGATDHPLWLDHLGETCAPRDWP